MARVLSFVTKTKMFLVSFLSVYPVTEIIWLCMENGINMLRVYRKGFKQIKLISEPQYSTPICRTK
jgi:hypothetical protein